MVWNRDNSQGGMHARLPCGRGAGLTGASSPPSKAGSAWRCLSGPEPRGAGKRHHSSLAVRRHSSLAVRRHHSSLAARRCVSKILLFALLGLTWSLFCAPGVLRFPPPPVPFPPPFPAPLPDWRVQKLLCSSAGSSPPSLALPALPFVPPSLRLLSSSSLWRGDAVHLLSANLLDLPP